VSLLSSGPLTFAWIFTTGATQAGLASPSHFICSGAHAEYYFSFQYIENNCSGCRFSGLPDDYMQQNDELSL
jgi:hypothetical protein